MRALWWIAGGLLALLWADRLRDAATGMRSIADISRPGWDKKNSIEAGPQSDESHFREQGRATNKKELVGPGALAGPALSLPQSTAGAGAVARRWPPVSIIVPARNEEHIVQEALDSLLRLDYPDLEILAIDDRSTDRTGAILDQLAARHSAFPPLRVIHISDLPSGWLGKPHAMWIAAQRAGGDWLLFTDADVIFRPDCLRRAIAYAERVRADHLVLPPTFDLETVGEKIMLAAFQMLFVFGHRPWKVADPRTKDFIGFGPFNLVRRRVYEAVGGFRALRMEVVEDMKLGKLVKQRGFAQRYVRGPELLRWRWGRGALGLVRNLTKNLFALMEFRWPKALGATFLLLLFNLGPLVGVWRAPRWARLPFAAALACIGGLHLGMARGSRLPARYFFLYPIGTLLMAYTMLRSIAHTLRHGGVVWRGTRYELDELRKGLV